MNYEVGILAGGKSVRMGENKAFLAWKDQSFLERMAKEFRTCKVTISAAKEGLYEELGFPVVYDELAGIGPLEGIRQLLMHATEEAVFICAVDMPFLQKELADVLVSAFSEGIDCVCLKDKEHIHPLCAIYARSVLGQVEALAVAPGKHRIRELLDLIHTRYVTMEETGLDKRQILNINTPEEYKQYCPESDNKQEEMNGHE